METVKTFEFDIELVQKLFQEETKDKGLEIINVTSAAACNFGDNYMSSVGRLTVSIKDSNSNISERHLLVKKLPENEVWRETFGCDSAFLNEAAAYRDVVSKMNEFCHLKSLAFPYCYDATMEHTILEDLKPKGFSMADRREGLDLAHAMLALEELGRFHGTSLAMKHSEPNAFSKLASSIKEIIFLPENKNGIGSALTNSVRMAVMALKVFRATGTDSLETIINQLQILKGSAFERLIQTVRPREPFSVICHGDFYVNNMLFKYNDSGDVTEVTVVDLQCFRYASLAIDILYFLFTSLRPGLVASHFNLLIEVYHSSLNRQIHECAPGAQQVSIKEIYDELESHSMYGLLMGILVLPAVNALPGAALDIEQVQSFSPEDHFERGLDLLSPGYFRRLHQLVMDYVELGYL